ncbi:MAG: helix-turn-helix domain-containing protein [Calditrichota bacterium]
MVQGEFITTAEVAKLLKVSSSTVQKMAREGRLSAIKVGKLWRFPAQSPEIMLYKQEQKTRRDSTQNVKDASVSLRNGLKEFLKLATHIGFIEPFDRAALREERP